MPLHSVPFPHDAADGQLEVSWLPVPCGEVPLASAVTAAQPSVVEQRVRCLGGLPPGGGDQSVP